MSEREKLKKLAEAIAPNDHLKVEASTILALLSELEQAERERDAARNCTVCTWCGEIQEHGGDWKTKVSQMFEHTEVCTKSPVKQLLNTKLELQDSEAALRTLRQASRDWLYVDRLWSKNVDEFGGIKQADEELNKRRNALAAWKIFSKHDRRLKGESKLWRKE